MRLLHARRRGEEGIAMITAILVSAVLTVSQTVAAAVNFPTIFHATLFIGHYILTPALFAALVVLLRGLRDRLAGGVGLIAESPAAGAQPRQIPTRRDQA